MRPRCNLLRPGRLDYQTAWELQSRTAAAVCAGAPPHLILLEHPPTYTLGVRGRAEHLLMGEAALAARGASVVRADRGGDVTFHGPGQLVGYPIVDLRALRLGPAGYVRTLESLLIEAVAGFGIVVDRSARNRGVWAGDAKLAAIGVRVSRGITTHGFALNVNTDLSYFDGIVACGMRDATVTSMQHLSGRTFPMQDVEEAVAIAFGRQFGVDLGQSATPEPEVAVGR